MAQRVGCVGFTFSGNNYVLGKRDEDEILVVL